MKIALTIEPGNRFVWKHNGQQNNWILLDQICRWHGVEQMKWEIRNVY